MPSSPNRRQFLAGLASTAVWNLSAAASGRLLVRSDAADSFHSRLAARELARGLMRLRLPGEVRLAGREQAGASDRLFVLRLDAERLRNAEAYEIGASGSTLTFSGGSEQALLYAVFEFLERQGALFGIDGENYPLDPVRELTVPAEGRPWTSSPRFAVRGLLPWPDFLNCISVYNEEDFRAYFEAMLRMRFNTFGMHVYTGANQWAESYLSFEFGGVGHLAFLDNSASHRWGYLPERTSRYGMGAADFYDGEVFGSDATRGARGPWETAEKTRRLLRESLAYARRLGLKTGIGFEPYQIPDEIWRALPPEVRPGEMPKRNDRGARFDVESVTARKLLEARLGQLLEAYPEVEHVWLWEDEGMNWESRRTGIPLSTTPFLQAHDFLRRHAPKKRMVLGGWGGVARHFEYFHQKMPGDVVFSCLSDSLGWDPIHEIFGKLEGRERWPIPWLEDDPGMWLTQLHVNRFQRDLNLAESYGCQGMIGIHWRHRIVDPTAMYQARFSWDKALTPEAHYAAYARTQAAGARAEELGRVLAGADSGRKLLSTGTREVKDGHTVTREYSGDYTEGFTFWNEYEPEAEVAASQRAVSEELNRLRAAATTGEERERVGYLAGHIALMVRYTEAFTLAHRMHGVLKRAGELRKAGKAAEAKALVSAEAVPLWLKLAPEVRNAMLEFQRIVATRNDLGTLASMHNKFVRLALVRLRLSLQEYLEELPAETESLLAEVTKPDAEARLRVFLPVRPTVLGKGEAVHVQIVAPGKDPVQSVTLYTRAAGKGQWLTAPASLIGRRTYVALLGPCDGAAPVMEYYVAVTTGNETVVSPPAGREKPHLVTVVG